MITTKEIFKMKEIIDFNKEKDEDDRIRIENIEFTVTVCLNQQGIDWQIYQIQERYGKLELERDRTGKFIIKNEKYRQDKRIYEQGVSAAYKELKFKND